MRKAMLSQPMAGKTDQEIIVTREKAVQELMKRGYQVVNTLSPTSGTARRPWRSVVWCRYRCAFWRSLWRT